MDLTGKKFEKGYAVFVKEKLQYKEGDMETLLGIYPGIYEARDKMREYYEDVQPDPIKYVSCVNSDQTMLSITSVTDPKNDYMILSIKEAVYII